MRVAVTRVDDGLVLAVLSEVGLDAFVLSVVACWEEEGTAVKICQ